MKHSRSTLLIFGAVLASMILAGCGRGNNSTSLTPSELAARKQEIAVTISKIQASKGTPDQKAQAIAALNASTQFQHN